MHKLTSQVLLYAFRLILLLARHSIHALQLLTHQSHSLPVTVFLATLCFFIIPDIFPHVSPLMVRLCQVQWVAWWTQFRKFLLILFYCPAKLSSQYRNHVGILGLPSLSYIFQFSTSWRRLIAIKLSAFVSKIRIFWQRFCCDFSCPQILLHYFSFVLHIFIWLENSYFPYLAPVFSQVQRMHGLPSSSFIAVVFDYNTYIFFPLPMRLFKTSAFCQIQSL